MIGTTTILHQVWSWIPAFHAVAQAGSVTLAAKHLSVSPPAISKSLKALEEHLGRTLFTRSNRGVTLTEAGRALHAATRNAVASLDYGLVASGVDALDTTVRVATMGTLDRLLIVPLAGKLNQEQPGLRLSVRSGSLPNEALAQLKTGDLDLFVAVNVSVGQPFASCYAGLLPMAVYIGPSHADFAADDFDDAAISALSYVARPPLEGMKSVWPRQVARDVRLHVDSHALAIDACRNAGYAMVMARAAAASMVEQGQLRELRASFLEPARMSLVCLEDRVHEPALQLLVDSARRAAPRVDA